MNSLTNALNAGMESLWERLVGAQKSVGWRERGNILGSSDLDKGSLGAQELQVASKRHLGRADGGHDQIEGFGVVGGPVLVLVCGDEPRSTHLLGVCLLGAVAAYGNDLGST